MNLSPFKLMCTAGFFAIFSSTLSKSPVLPLFAAHLGATASGVGIVAAVSTLAGVAFSIPAGMLSDRFGRKTMLIAAGVVFASAPLLYLFTRQIWQLAAVRFYHGLATAIFMPVAMAFVSDLHEDAKGEKLGWFSTATLLGRFIAPLTGGALLGFLGASGDISFTLIYSVCLVGGVFALFISAKIPSVESRPRTFKGWKHQMTGLTQLVTSRPLLAFGIVEASILFMYGTIEVFLPLYALSQGIGTFQIGVCLSAQVMALAATKPIMGKLSDRYGRSGQIIWGALLGVVAAASMAGVASFALLLILSVLIGLSLAVVTSATSAAVADISRCEMRGSAMGIFGTIMDVGHSAGPIVSGVVASYLGFKAAFMGAAIVLAFAIIAFKAITFNKPQPCSISEQGQPQEPYPKTDTEGEWK
jgi:MFS transporter, DHA1 family, multidrug resistance protein